uniref:UDP-N-acetylmuramoyl-L-alanyl-D-glutamate--2, 6-diaminopimelate ligase n=1 Tax=Anthurium amnicola TaxID=1678845 RepID=A0A1D1YBW7_9ARAE
MTPLYPPKISSSSSSYPHNPSKSRNNFHSLSLQNLSSPPPTLKSTLKSPPLLPVTYPDLPSDPKRWSSSHVASYLTYCLRIYPPAIVSDLTRHIEEDVALTGRKFLRLKEEQLRQMNFNEGWIKLIMIGVKSLRRDHLKDKILLNGGDIVGGVKIIEESSEESGEEQYSPLTRNSSKRRSSYSSTTVSSNSSFSSNDIKDFLIPTFTNLTSDDKKFISQEFNKLKEFLKSDIEKKDNTSFNELNRVIEKAISNIELNQEENDIVKNFDGKIGEIDEKKSKHTNSFFWAKIESGFAQGVMIGGLTVWAFMRYHKW